MSFKHNDISDSLAQQLAEVGNKLKDYPALPDIQNPAKIFLSNKTKGGASYVSQLRKMAEWLDFYDPDDKDYYQKVPWHKIDPVGIKLLVQAYDDAGYKPATSALAFSALKGVLKEAYLLKFFDQDQWLRIQEVSNEGAKKIKSQPVGDEIKDDLIIRLMRACQEDDSIIHGTRDLAIISVLRGTGMRRSTISTIKMKDIDLHLGVINAVIKKGKFLEHALPPKTKEALLLWLDIRGYDGEFLFCPIKKSVIYKHKSLSDQMIHGIIDRRRKEAGIRKKITPHDFRRTFITDLIRKKGIAVAQDFAGHESMDTTKRYDRSKFDERLKAALDIDVPLPE